MEELHRPWPKEAVWADRLQREAGGDVPARRVAGRCRGEPCLGLTLETTDRSVERTLRQLLERNRARRDASDRLWKNHLAESPDRNHRIGSQCLSVELGMVEAHLVDVSGRALRFGHGEVGFQVVDR